MKRLILLIALLPLLGPLPARAAAMLEDDVKLAPMVRLATSVLLVDARNPKSRQLQPIQGSMPYRDNMALKPGLVIVVGENDRQALEVAQLLAASGGRKVYALKGGVDAWLRIKRREEEDASSAMPESFVIPHNTCEQGSAIQKYGK